MTIRPHPSYVILTAGEVRAHVVCPSLALEVTVRQRGQQRMAKPTLTGFPKLFIRLPPRIKLDIWPSQNLKHNPYIAGERWKNILFIS